MERDNVPAAIILVNGDAIRWTALLAHAAQDAIIGIKYNVALQAQGLRLLLNWIQNGLGLFEQGPERHFS